MAEANASLSSRGVTRVGVLAAEAALCVVVSGVVVHRGGTISKAPVAILWMFAGLLVLSFTGAAIARRDRLLRILSAAILILVFEAASWRFTASHSVLGDFAVMILSAVPVAVGTAIGESVGRRRGRIAERR